MRTETLSALLALSAAATVLAQPAPGGEPMALLELRVRGNTLLSVREIERALLPFVGPRRSAADLEAARAALEKAYHDRGYLTVVVDVPEPPAGGVVLLAVTQASIRRTRVTGATYSRPQRLRDALPALAEGSVPDFDALQRELAEANRSPDRQVTPVLRPAPVPGTIDVDLQVKDRLALHGGLEVNDRYSLNTSRERVVGQLHYDNLFQLGHSIGLQVQAAPVRPDDARVWSLSYALPLSGGRSLSFSATRSRSEVAALGGLDVVGNGSIYAVRALFPLASTPEGSAHTLTLGADYKNLGQDIGLPGTGAVSAPVAYVPLTAGYGLSMADSGGRTSLDAGVTANLRGLHGDSGQFPARASAAEANFTVTHASLQRLQALPGAWSLQLRSDLQLASGSLVSSEQYAGGGASSVRGYLEAETLGDDAWRGSVELRTPHLGGRLAGLDSAYFLAFADGAHLVVRDPLPGQQAAYSLASVGVGLRLAGRGLSLDADGAHALRSAVSAGVPGNTTAGENRLHLRLAYEF